MIGKTKLLLCLCVFASTIVNVTLLQQADCSSCPTDATGCDITEETTGDTTLLITTVKCKRGNQNVGEFQNSAQNPYPGTHSKRTFHRSHTTTFNSRPIYNTIQDPYAVQFGREQQQGFSANRGVNMGVAQNGRYVQGNDGYYQGGFHQVDPYFDPSYAQRQAQALQIQERLNQQRQATFNLNSKQGFNSGYSTTGQNGRYVQAGSALQNGQSPTSRCDPCPYDAVGCNIHEETTQDTSKVVTTTTCLDSKNLKISEVQTTKQNPLPGTYFTRTFYESHGSYTSHY